jgi:hypothetical protein
LRIDTYGRLTQPPEAVVRRLVDDRPGQPVPLGQLVLVGVHDGFSI